MYVMLINNKTWDYIYLKEIASITITGGRITLIKIDGSVKVYSVLDYDLVEIDKEIDCPKLLAKYK